MSGGRHALICGGSIGGLFAAAALRARGWSVEVLERTEVPLAGRGAGIVTHPELVAALEAVGADTADLGVDVFERVAYDLEGARVHAIDFHQVVTSWDRMYRVLRAILTDAEYRLGVNVVGYDDSGARPAARLADGGRVEADLVVGADGFRSAIRGQMLPEVRPEYSGYVVWRTVAAEADLPADVHADIGQTFGFFIPNGTEIIGYPIAGPDNDLAPGRRRYNFVWYAEVPQAGLDDMLTDATGRRHELSIPPPLVRDDLIEKAMDDARRQLPRPFVDLLKVSERPFFTPIYDHHSPVMAEGRVALSGDAACVARPHVGMGVTKAAEDALALARHLDAAPLSEALSAYSAERVAACRIAYERSQWLGRFIFEGDRSVNQDGRSHPHWHTVMRETAVVPPPGGGPQALSSS